MRMSEGMVTTVQYKHEPCYLKRFHPLGSMNVQRKFHNKLPIKFWHFFYVQVDSLVPFGLRNGAILRGAWKSTENSMEIQPVVIGILCDKDSLVTQNFHPGDGAKGRVRGHQNL